MIHAFTGATRFELVVLGLLKKTEIFSMNNMHNRGPNVTTSIERKDDPHIDRSSDVFERMQSSQNDVRREYKSQRVMHNHDSMLHACTHTQSNCWTPTVPFFSPFFLFFLDLFCRLNFFLPFISRSTFSQSSRLQFSISISLENVALDAFLDSYKHRSLFSFLKMSLLHINAKIDFIHQSSNSFYKTIQLTPTSMVNISHTWRLLRKNYD